MRAATMTAIFMLLILDAGRASAQAVETGAGVAFSCKSVGISPCTYEWGRVDAVHVNWWRSQSLVVEARAAHLEGPRTRIVAVGERVSATETFFRSYTLRDERRTLLQASVLYHFRSGRTVRPFIGGGLGAMWWRGEAYCDRSQFECERVLPDDRVQRSREFVGSIAAGLAFDTGRGVILRTGMRDTMIPWAAWRSSNESVRRRAVQNQLPEYFFSAGYRW